MKLFSGVMALLFALAISSVAAFFSVTGLGSLFQAAYWPVVLMGTALETGKLFVAAWLHSNWSNPRVSFFHKTYLFLAIVALMLITSIGIYGYLAKGFLEQQVPLGAVGIQIEQRQQQIATDQDTIRRLNERQAQLDKAVDALLDLNQIAKSQTIRAQQKNERSDIAADLSSAQKEIERLSNELVPLKLSTNDVRAKLGPIKFVAQLFGWADPEYAVRIVILVIMFAFDPLAVVLVISGTISIGEWVEQRKKPPLQTLATAVVHSSVPKRLDTGISVEAVPVSGDSDRDTIRNILQRNPLAIEEIIDAAIESHGGSRAAEENSK